jgi:hypothetical protein
MYRQRSWELPLQEASLGIVGAALCGCPLRRGTPFAFGLNQNAEQHGVAHNDPQWLAITSANSGSGNGTVNYSVAVNPGTTSRTGALTIVGQPFTVTQGGQVSSGIIVLTPNGGETWPIGSAQTIQWNSSGVSGKVKIELSRDGGATWATLFNNTANNGTKNWKVTKPATTQARIRVSSVNSPSVADTSNANFIIQ